MPSVRPTSFLVKTPATFAITLASALFPAAVWANAQVEPHEQTEVMVVTASGHEQNLSEAPASITVINREDLIRNEVSSLADAIRGVQGVNVNYLDARDGKTGNQSVSLRGLPRDYTLIMIDGVRQNPTASVAPNSFVDSQSVFIPPVSAIEQIEIIRGPMSTLYGSDALGGVINIITRRPGPDTTGTVALSSTFQTDADFGGRAELDAFVSGAATDTRFRGQAYVRLTERAASRIDIPGVEPSLEDNRTMGQNPVGADTRTMGTKLFFLPDANHEFSLRTDYNEQVYDNQLGQIGRIRRDATGQFRDGYSDELRFERLQVALEHRGHLDVGTWTTQVSHDVMETKGRTIPQGYFAEPSLDGAPRELKLETNLISSNLAIPLGDHTLTVGGQYLDPAFSDGLIQNTISSERYSLYAQDEWRVTPDLLLTLGARYENDADAGSEVTPRAYAVYNLNPDWIVKGGVSRGFRTPYLEQKYDGVIGFGDGGSTPLYGNPELQNERSTNYEIGVSYQGDGGFSGQFTLFQNELDNLVESGTGANSGQDLNIGEARLRGLEASFRYEMNDFWWLTGNYTFTDSEVTYTQQDTGDPAQRIASREGDPLVSVPDHMANARLNWQATANIAAFLEVEHRSDAFRPRNFHEPMTGGTSQAFVEPGVRDSYAVLGDFKGYSLVNLGASWRLSSNVELRGVVNNLLNRDFMDYQAYQVCADSGCTQAETGFSNRYNSIREPAQLHLSLRVQF